MFQGNVNGPFWTPLMKLKPSAASPLKSSLMLKSRPITEYWPATPFSECTIVKFQIIMFSVNCMLGRGMPMELCWFELPDNTWVIKAQFGELFELSFEILSFWTDCCFGSTYFVEHYFIFWTKICISNHDVNRWLPISASACSAPLFLVLMGEMCGLGITCI